MPSLGVIQHTMDNTRQAQKQAPYKRRMTEKRRDQNRAAQKAYRVRRKERLEQLERQVTALEQQGVETSPSSNARINGYELASERTIVDLNEENNDLSDDEPPLPTTDSSFGFKHLLRDSDAPDLDSLVEFALREQPDITDILISGLRMLKLEKEKTTMLEKKRQPVTWATGTWQRLTSNHNPGLIYPLPNPSTDGIFLSRQSQIEVVFHNCMKIGLSIEEFMKPTCQSPWYSPLSKARSSALTSICVPPDLIPTPAQICYPHHPFIDTIPFPWFRERAIKLASMDPPAYNRIELKKDILRGGLTVWRSRGKEEGLPWDRRNWEVQPWFWEKWSWLIEEQGRVEQQSGWWRSMRGQ